MEGLKLKYKGFEGTVMWSDEDKCWVGRLLDLPQQHSVCYGGEDMDGLIETFIDAIDTYLEELEFGWNKNIRIIY